jgi:transcriptional regulator with PAS, ATPase and Fis domain
LASYDWPGNIRELRNVLEREMTMGEDSGVLDADAIFRALPRQNAPNSGHMSEIQNASFRPWSHYVRKTGHRWPVAISFIFLSS